MRSRAPPKNRSSHALARRVKEGPATRSPRAPGGTLVPPGPPAGSGCAGHAILLEHPVLDPLDVGRVALARTEVVEEPPLRGEAEGPRGKGHGKLALGGAPDGEPDEFHAVERSALVKEQLGIADEALGPVHLVDKLYAHGNPPSKK